MTFKIICVLVNFSTAFVCLFPGAPRALENYLFPVASGANTTFNGPFTLWPC